jgi:hypothetical protein
MLISMVNVVRQIVVIVKTTVATAKKEGVIA